MVLSIRLTVIFSGTTGRTYSLIRSRGLHWQMPELKSVGWGWVERNGENHPQWSAIDYFNFGYLVGTCKSPRSAGAY